MAEYRYRRGGVLLTALGIASWAVSLAFVVILWEEDSAVVPALRVLAAGFGLAGAVLVLARRGVSVDGSNKVLVRWWGPLVPLYRRKYSTRDYNRVNMVEKTLREGNSERTFYEVFLDNSESRSEPLAIDRTNNYRSARKGAEQIARTLEVPMVEFARGRKLVRDHLHLDESIRDRLKRLGRELKSLPAPAKMRSAITWGPGGCTVNIPASSNIHLSGREVVTVLLIGMATLLAFAGLTLFEHVPYFFALPILAFPPAVFIVAGWLSRGKHHTRIVVTAEALRVEETDIFGLMVKELPLADIEEFELHTRRGREGLMAISDEKTILFAPGLPDDELKFLHAEIQRAFVLDSPDPATSRPHQ